MRINHAFAADAAVRGLLRTITCYSLGPFTFTESPLGLNPFASQAYLPLTSVLDRLFENFVVYQLVKYVLASSALDTLLIADLKTLPFDLWTMGGGE